MDVKEWVVATKTRRLFTSGSINLAQSLVKVGEKVEMAFVARVGANSALDDNKTRGVLVLTNDRVIYASKMLWNASSKYIRIPDIQAVGIKQGLFNCTLNIKGLSESFEVEHWKKSLLLGFQRKLEELVNGYRSKEQAKVAEIKVEKNETTSIKEQLEDLNQLLKEEIITQEEFEQKKKQILGL